MRTAGKENCKRVAELGVRSNDFNLVWMGDNLYSRSSHQDPRDTTPAYTLDELLEMAKDWSPIIEGARGLWWAYLTVGKKEIEMHHEDNPADALALCIIEALEKELITAEELNK